MGFVRHDRVKKPGNGNALAVKTIALAGTALLAGGGGGAAAAQEPPPAQGRTYDLFAFEVEGNSVLDEIEVKKVIAPYLGPDRTLADIQAARAALEKAYQDKGYQTVIVDVPQQDITDAVLRFSVIEGRVDRVRVVGANYYLPSRVKDALPSLQEDETPNIPALREELQEANLVPGRRIEPQFRAGLAPGTVEVDLSVEDRRPWGGSIVYNDQYNPETSRTRLAAALRYDNLWQRGHSANVQFQMSPEDPDEIQVWSGSYFFPVIAQNLNVVMYFVDSNTDVATVGDVTVLGEGQTYGARGIWAIGDDPNFVQSFMFGADFRDSADDIGFEDATFQRTLSYLTGTTQYRGIAIGANATTSFNVGATFGVDGLINDRDEFLDRRQNADPSFVYFYAGLERQQRLDDVLSLTAGVDGQFSEDPLISNEQFSLGGVQSVRGYRQAEVLGDRGVRGSVQLDASMLDLGKVRNWVPGAADEWMLFAFVDGGYVNISEPQEEQQDEFLLGSVGVGTQMKFFDFLTLRGDAAYLLDRDPGDTGENVETDTGNVRFHFSVGAEF